MTEMTQLNRVQDAELLHESIRSMKQLSTEAATIGEVHAFLGHLARAGHLLPEVLTEFGDSLTATVAKRAETAELLDDVHRCEELLDEAADLAYRAGTVLRHAQQALERHV